MIRYFILFVYMFPGIISMAQNEPRPGEPGFLDKYSGFDFRGKFSALIQQDEKNNYFILDFSLLENRFEKVYFINKSFGISEIVNMGFEPTKNIVCFKSFTIYPEKEVIEKFKILFEQTKEASRNMNQDEKSAWLIKNDKYK